MLKDDILEFVENYNGDRITMSKVEFLKELESFLESKTEQEEIEILITIEGGLVQNVTSRDDKRIKAAIIDFDTDGRGGNIHKDCDGEDIEAYIYESFTEPNSEVLDFYIKELEKI